MSSSAAVINVTSAFMEPIPDPAATHVRKSGVSIYLKHAISPRGMLKILAFVFGLLAWSLFAYSHTANASIVFALFVAVMSLITTVIACFVFFRGFHADLISEARCMLIHLALQTFCALFYFFATRNIAISADQVSKLMAAKMLLCFVFVLHFLHVLHIIQDRRLFAKLKKQS